MSSSLYLCGSVPALLASSTIYLLWLEGPRIFSFSAPLANVATPTTKGCWRLLAALGHASPCVRLDADAAGRGALFSCSKRSICRLSRIRGLPPYPARRKKPCSGSLPLVGGARHVLYGDASFCSGALHLGKVDPQLLGLLLGRLRGVGLFLAASPTGCALSLLGSLPRGVLGLLGGTPGGFLGLARRLPSGLLHLARSLARSILHSLRRLPGLPEHSPDGICGLPSDLPHGFLGSSAFLPPAG